MAVRRLSEPRLRMSVATVVAAGLLASGMVALVGVRAQPAVASAPTPSWWSGACDVNNHPGSYELGTTSGGVFTPTEYDGVVACGPGPLQGGYDHEVHFFSGAWGEYEWECVELVMRFMYLVYGIAPYNANGNTVVSNYRGNVLTQVANNGASLPSPGDILSWAGTSLNPDGHTAVVTAVNVANGNGSITVMQQNAAPNGNGWGTVNVSGNVLTTKVYGGSVTGWLHDPDGSGGRGPQGALTDSSPLQITDPGGWYFGTQIDETFTVENTTSRPVTAQRLILAVRDPGGNNYDQVCAYTLTLAAGASYTCDLKQTWGQAGTYTVWPDWLDASGNWHAGQLGATQKFTLTWPWSIVASVPLTITNPGGNYFLAPTDETFQVTNTTGSPITMRRLTLAVRDPGGNNYDQTCAKNLTLAAGHSHTCTMHQNWGSAGTYTMWIDWQDPNGLWHSPQLGPSQQFTLAWPGSLVATRALTITDPSGWYFEVPIDATWTVHNSTGKPIHAARLIMAVRDPGGNNYDQLCKAKVTIAAYGNYACNLKRTWGQAGTYTVWADWEDTSGNFHAGQLGPTQTFTLTWPWSLAASAPLVITAPDGYYTHKPIDQRYTVKNTTSKSITARNLIIGVTGPRGTNEDLVCATNITIAPGATRTCRHSQTWAMAGTYTIWADWKDTRGNLHYLQLGPTQTFRLRS